MGRRPILIGSKARDRQISDERKRREIRAKVGEDSVFGETQLLAKLNELEKLPRVESIFFCSWKIAYSSASGRGGQPGT